MAPVVKPPSANLEKEGASWVDAETAISASSNPFSAMAKATDRVKPAVWPNVTSEFPIEPGAKIFTIGSCFARNVEDNLHALGFDLPTLEFTVPQEELPGRSTNLLNKYTPASIYQEVAFAHSILKKGGNVSLDDVSWLSFEEREGQFLDLGLATLKTVSIERLIERRQMVFDIFKKAFESEVVTLTLGLIEAWYDRENDTFVQFAPSRSMRKQKGRFAFCQMDYNLCLEYIRRTIDLIRSENDCKFLITTSPVSLARTFTDLDVIVANMESKAVLRAVCGQIGREYECVGYFPSFESAVLTKDPNVYLDDNIHVSPDFVGQIVGSLVDSYFSSASQARVSIQKARLELIRNRPEIVISLLQNYKNDPDFSIEGVTLLMQALIRSKKYEYAASFGQEREALGIDNEPKEIASRFYSVLRSAFVHCNEIDEAIRCAQTAIRYEPLLPVWYFEYASTLFRAGRYDEAEKIYIEKEKWIDNHSKRFQYSQTLSMLNKKLEAKNWIYPIKDDNMTENMYFHYANLLRSMAYIEESDDVVEKGLLIYPDSEMLKKLAS